MKAKCFTIKDIELINCINIKSASGKSQMFYNVGDLEHEITDNGRTLNLTIKEGDYFWGELRRPPLSK